MAAVSPPVSTRLIDNFICLNAASCRAGGAICGNAALWQVGTTAYDVVSAVPSSTRWDSSESLDVRALYGAFLSQIDLFEQSAFSLSPAEADIMDPQQRIALEEGYAALSASGLNRSKLVNSITGVFGGLWPSDYATVLPKRGAVGRGPLAVAATGPSMLVGRLSYTLGMQGPCVAFDTACSAALSACQGAMDALKSRDSSVGLVFSVNVMCDSNSSQLFAAAQMLSPSGKSHAFDARANGYARGEACCCAVLMPETAEMRRVRCDAGAVRQDGKSASLTAPNGTAQQALIRAALTRAGRPPRGTFMLEAHGTGTSLGDPIEARAMCAVREETHLMSVMGCKANIGHTEPTAGVAGLLQLAMTVSRSVSCPNAQLRIMNPHVKATFNVHRHHARHDGSPCLPTQSSVARTWELDLVGGVSSFGLNGTIAHVVLSAAGGVSLFGYSDTIMHAVIGFGNNVNHETLPCGHGQDLALVVPLVYRRRAFPWRDRSHAFAQCRITSLDGFVAFRSPAAGALHALVSNHIVQGRVVCPGAGYLEMVRAAGATAMHGVYFLQLLAVEVFGLLVECTISDGRFEVRSSEDEALEGAAVHCSGSVAMDTVWQRVDNASLHTLSHAADVGALYDGFDTVGLQYGPGYRTLTNAWGGVSDALARLRARSTLEGTQVHPADLDDALCAGAVVASSGGAGEAQLPFAVDDAVLQGAVGELWAVCCSSCTPCATAHVAVLSGLAGCVTPRRPDVFLHWAAPVKARRLENQSPPGQPSSVQGASLALRDRMVVCCRCSTGVGTPRASCHWQRAHYPTLRCRRLTCRHQPRAN
ncbi:polyketide synthase dehydratase domain-containing protein [bacterium]|nr:polyketide synthase dehydratase domain-containing protein [bacterium]